MACGKSLSKSSESQAYKEARKGSSRDPSSSFLSHIPLPYMSPSRSDDACWWDSLSQNSELTDFFILFVSESDFFNYFSTPTEGASFFSSFQ